MKRYGVVAAVLAVMLLSVSCGVKPDKARGEILEFKKAMTEKTVKMELRLKEAEKKLEKMEKSNKKHAMDEIAVMRGNIRILEKNLEGIEKMTEKKWKKFRQDMDVSANALQTGIESLMSKVEKEIHAKHK